MNPTFCEILYTILSAINLFIVLRLLMTNKWLTKFYKEYTDTSTVAILDLNERVKRLEDSSK